MIVHCPQCGVAVEVELLAPLPDQILCAQCRQGAEGPAHEPLPGGDVSVEIEELGSDGGVLGLTFTF